MSSQPKIIPPPDLISPQIAPYSVDLGVSEALRALVERGLAQSGSQLIVPVRFCNLDQAAQVVGRAVAFYDGALHPGLAPLLRRGLPALLCATRERGLVSEWELKTLFSMLGGRPIGPSAVNWRRLVVHSVAELESASEAAGRAAVELGGTAAAAELVIDVVHELLANALLDAPVDAEGKPKYAFRRDQEPVISPEDGCKVAFGATPAGDRLMVLVTDRFGRLAVDPLADSIEELGRPARLKTGGGGAGLGMRRLLENSDLLAVRVAKGRRTEVLCAVDLHGPRRRAGSPKSVFYLQTGQEEAK